MNVLGRMHKKFRKKNDEQSINVSTRKSFSCFSALWGLHEQQYYREENNLSAHFSQPKVRSKSSVTLEANSVEDVNEEEMADTSLEFFQTFLAIGTLGSISIIEESMPPIVAMQTEAALAEKESQSLNNLEKPNEKEVHDVSNESPKGNVFTFDKKEIKGMDTKLNKSMATCLLKESSAMPPTKEEATKQKPRPDKLFHMQFMKKMLKKLDFTSKCNPTKVFRKSRKIHPEAGIINVTNTTLHNYEIKHTCDVEDNDKQVTLENEGNMHPHDEMLKKEIVSCHPTGEKAHWIKTDADYFVLEF